MAKKKTKIMAGFKSQKGKAFSASLTLNPNQEEKFKVLFVFAPKKFAAKKILII